MKNNFYHEKGDVMICKHESVLKILKKGDGHTTCLVLHYKPDGSIAPTCIICPDCQKHVDWKVQEAMLAGFVKKAMLGFRVYLDETEFEGLEKYRELTDEEIEEARFMMTHDGRLVRDESYINYDTGKLIRYVRTPKDVYAVPR